MNWALAAFTKWWRQSASHARRAWQWLSLQVWLILNPKVDEVTRVYAGRFLSLYNLIREWNTGALLFLAEWALWWMTSFLFDVDGLLNPLARGDSFGWRRDRKWKRERRHKCSFSFNWTCSSGWTMSKPKFKCHSWCMFCQTEYLAIFTSPHFPPSAYQISNNRAIHAGCQAVIAISN